MGAFKFRLEPVVSLKKKVEDERKMALAVAKKDLRQRETRLINLCERKQECQNMMGAAMDRGNLDISQKLIYYAYIERLADEIASHTTAVERSKEDVETKRDLLLESSREKKALEKLRERLRERHLAEARKCEQKSLDETAAKLHRRKGDGKLVWNKE
jgi:flagellar FliJ protein